MNLMPIRIGILKAATALYQQTGISLLKYAKTQPVPVEHSFGGEAGLFYFVPLFASFFDLSALDAAWWFLLVQVFSGVFFAGTALLSQAKTLLGKSIVLFGVSGLGGVAWLSSDVYVTYFFTVSFFPWFLFLLEKKYYKSLCAYSLLVGLVIEYGNFVRSFSGLPLLVGTIVAVVCSCRVSRKTFLLLSLLTLGIGSAKLHIHNVIKHRNQYLHRQRYVFKEAKLQHTFWHNIYMGFGFITNNKNINFSDGCSMARVKEIDGQAVYLNSHYESILRNEVINLCFYSPNFVLRVLFAKLGILIYYFLLFSNIGLIAAYYSPKSWRIEIPYLAMLFIGALPGFLTIPTMLYLLGFVSVAVLYGVHSVIHFLNVYFCE